MFTIDTKRGKTNETAGRRRRICITSVSRNVFPADYFRYANRDSQNKAITVIFTYPAIGTKHIKSNLFYEKERIYQSVCGSWFQDSVRTGKL